MITYDYLVRGVEAAPDSPAIYYHDETITYGSLKKRVDLLAAALAQRGIGAGDSVAVLLPNHPAFTIIYYAANRLGAVCVPVNPLLKPAELAYIWGDCKAKIVFTVDAFVPSAREAIADFETKPIVVSIQLASEATASDETLPAMMAGAIIETIENINLPADNDPAVCIYTSGTTGRPKGALLSHRNLTENCRQATMVLVLTPSDNFLCVLPLFHSFAGTVCQNLTLSVGASFTILEQFHPVRIIEAIEARGVTLFAGVPAMYQGLLRYPFDKPVNFRSVRLCVSGGAPMPIPVMEAFEKQFETIIIEGDGPTECSPVTCLNPIEGVRKPGSVGLALPDMEMKIFDDDDTEVPGGEVGEIVVRGPNVMLGYLNQPEETAAAMKNRWYHTGDLGYVDSDGYFFIVDRKKDMLLVGGFNVYPREIEEVLYTHPAVADAAVIGIPDKLKGEEPLAVVVVKPGAEVTGRDLINHCKSQLANYKVPRKVEFRDTLPRGGTGKILKRLLRKEMELEPPV